MRKKYLVIVTLFVILILAIQGLSNLNNNKFYNTTLPEHNTPKLKNPNDRNPLVSYQTSAWWNYSFDYRREIQISETAGKDRVNEPVVVTLSFDPNKAYNNSIRIVDNSNAEIPSQVIYSTFYAGTSYYAEARVLFLVNISALETKTYWVYYTPRDVGAPIYSNWVSYIFDGTKVNISNGIETIIFSEGDYGIRTFRLDEMNNPLNFHTPCSLNPYPYEFSIVNLSYAYLIGSYHYLRVFSYDDNNYIEIINASSGETLVSDYRNKGESLRYPSSGAVPNNILVQIKATKPVGVMVSSIGTSGTYNYGVDHASDDGIYSLKGRELFLWVPRDLWISTYEPAHVEIYDILGNLKDSFDLAAWDMKEYAGSSSIFNNDYLHIVSNVTIMVVAGYDDNDVDTEIYGISQRKFLFPMFGAFSFYALKTGHVEVVELTPSTTVLLNGTVNEGDVKYFYRFNGDYEPGDPDYRWVKIDSDVPLILTTGDPSSWDGDLYGIGTDFHVLASIGGLNAYVVALNNDTDVQWSGYQTGSTTLNKSQVQIIDLGGGGAIEVHITSNKPVLVFTEADNHAETIFYGIAYYGPKIESITKEFSGPLAVRFKITWESENRTHWTDYLTVYGKYRGIRIDREIYFDATVNRAYYNLMNTFFNIPDAHFGRVVSYPTNLNYVFETTYSANYTAFWYSSGLHESSAIGIALTNVSTTGSVTITNAESIEWITNFNYYHNSLEIKPGAYKLQISTSGGSSNLIRATFWEWGEASVGDENQINNWYNIFKNPISYSVGSEEVIYFNVVLHVIDKDNRPVDSANVTFYQSGIKKYTAITNTTGYAEIHHVLKGTYDIWVNWTNNDPIYIKPFYILNKTYSNTDISSNLALDVVLSLVDITFTAKNLLGDTLSYSVLIDVYNGSEKMISESTDANGQVKLPRIKVGSYIVNTTYIPKQLNGYTNLTYSEYTFTKTDFVDLILPLTRMTLYFDSRENEPVKDVLVGLSYLNGSGISESPQYTDAYGKVDFINILNGSWHITYSYQNSYGQIISGSFDRDVQESSLTENVSLPLTSLYVCVRDYANNNETVTNAYVNVSIGANEITSKYTDENGWAVFKWLKADETYNVQATKLKYTNSTNVLLTSNTSIVIFLNITYTEYDTLLESLNATAMDAYWGDIITIKVNFTYAINGTGITGGSVSYILKYLNGTEIPGGSTSFSEEGEGIYSATIDIMNRKLNATFTYMVFITASKQGLNDPPSAVIYLTVLTTPTAHNVSITTMNVVWSENISLLIEFKDIRHNVTLSDANATFEIIGSTACGPLQPTIIGGSTYYLLNENTSNPASLNLPEGTYILKIYLVKKNYQQQTIEITLNVQPKPANLEVFHSEVNVCWSNTFVIVAKYYSGSFIFSNAHINASWENSGYIYLPYAFNGTHYFLNITTDLLDVGTYTLKIKAKIQNYTYEEVPITVHILPIPTSLDAVSGYTYVVDYNSQVEITVAFMDTNHSNPINGATLYINWTNPFKTELGNGQYSVLITANNNPGVYVLNITLSKKNYASSTVLLSLKILSPIEIHVVTEKNNIITTYWNENYTVAVYVTDLYYGINVTGLDIYVSSTFLPQGIKLTWNGSYYVIELNSTLSKTPGTFNMKINATGPDYSFAETTFGLRINAIPTEFRISEPIKKTVPYGNIVNFSLTWWNLLSNTSQKGPDTIETFIVFHEKILTDKHPTVYDLGNGTFIISVNTSILDPQYFDNEFKITFLVSKHGYVLSSSATFTVVVPIPTSASVFKGYEERTGVWNSTPIVTFITYVDTLHNVNLTSEYNTEIIANWTSISVEDLGNGKYRVSLLTSDIPFAPGVYTINITITAPNFEPATVFIRLTLLEPAKIEVNETIYNVYHNEVLSVSVFVRSLYNHQGIPNATVKFVIGNNVYYATEISAGLYTVSINVSAYDIGSYIISVTAIKEGIYSEEISLSLIVKKVPLDIISETIIPSLSIEQGTENVTIQFVLIETVHGSTVSGAQIKVLLNNTEIGNAQELESGHYLIVVNTSKLEIGRYELLLLISKEYCEMKNVTYTIIVTEPTFTIPVVNAKVPRTTVYITIGGSMFSASLIGLSLYAYRLYKIPKIIRDVDKAIKFLVKGKTVDFSKFPDLNDLLEEEIAPLFSSVKARIPHKTTE